MAVSPVTDLLIADEIYGEVRLGGREDAPLIALIQSPAFQRLRHTLQHGISSIPSIAFTPKVVSRYSHSIGACLLVRRLGGSLEAQIAALLHDISHTALSHVTDAAFGRVVHEEDKLVYLETTNIPAILDAFGVSRRVLHEENYTLLELPSPRLCADRTDYALRDSVAFGILDAEQVAVIVNDLAAYEGEIVCTSLNSARLLSDAYLAADAYAWSNARHAAVYKFAADTITAAFDVKQLAYEDLWSAPSCDAFWERLVNSPHPRVRDLASRVKGNIRVQELQREEAETLTESHKVELELKPRVLDPTVVLLGHDSEPRPLSAFDPDYARKVSEYKASKKGRRFFEVSYEEA